MQLIHGGLLQHTLINGIQVAIAARKSLPFPVEAMVFEEDRNLILTVDQAVDYIEEHPIRTMTAVMEAQKHKPGSVVINGKSWYAVVIDLDREAICR